MTGAAAVAAHRPVRGRGAFPLTTNLQQDSQQVNWLVVGASAAKPIRIVILDDHDVMAQGLALSLLKEGQELEVVGTATSRDAGTALVGELLPDVVLMHVDIAGDDAIKAAQQIRDRFGAVSIVILSGSEAPVDVQRAMELPVRGYLSKKTGARDIALALKAADAGHVVLSPFAVNALCWESPPELTLLNDSERQLLTLVAEGLDNPEVARRLNISESTLKRILSKIQNVLGARNRVQAAVNAARKGII